MIKVIIEATSNNDMPAVEKVKEALDKMGIESILRVISTYRKHPQSYEPYFNVNLLTGFKRARMMENAEEHAYLIKRASRPLMVLGPRILNTVLDGKPLIEYAVEIAQAVNLPICATAHTQKRLLDLGITPENNYDIIEIINHLKDKNWRGVRKVGNHDLVIFLGVRCDLAEQGLSTLKHFAPHLKTMTLCQNYHPNANYSFPNFKADTWKEYLLNLIAKLKQADV